MCGLAGVLGRQRGPQWAVRLVGALEARGPDEIRYLDLAPLSLMASRFSTIDSAGGRQPMQSSDGRYTIAANCEILNFRELRSELESITRQPFHSQGDLEVALGAFVIHGLPGFELLRGPFAIVIWDAVEHKLVLARDRLGERPLFVSHHDGEVYFGSSIAALAAMDVPIVLDDEAAARFLILGGTATCTVAQGVRQVPPGTVEIHRPGALAAHRFARLESTATLTSTEVGAAFDEALNRVVETDQSLALALSGGLDSTSLLAGLAERDVVVATVTVVNGPDDPTRERALRAVRKFRSEHHELMLTLPDAVDAFNLLKVALDTPASEPVVIHNHALHRTAAEFGRVLLAGHGADEILAGHRRYSAVFKKGSSTPSAMPLSSPAAVDVLVGEYGRWTNALVTDPYLAACGIGQEVTDEIRTVVTEMYLDCLGRAQGCPATAAQILDIELFDWWELFALPDENSLIQGVEVRSPFYDADLIATALNCDARLRFGSNIPKASLRAWADNRVPYEVFGESKLGFDSAFDYSGWIADHVSTINDIVGDSLAGVLDMRMAISLPTSHRAQLVWRAFALAAWLEGVGDRSGHR
jgi:asparagine synthase (glutamine-hydrolysing)